MRIALFAFLVLLISVRADEPSARLQDAFPLTDKVDDVSSYGLAKYERWGRPYPREWADFTPDFFADDAISHIAVMFTLRGMAYYADSGDTPEIREQARQRYLDMVQRVAKQENWHLGNAYGLSWAGGTACFSSMVDEMKAAGIYDETALGIIRLLVGGALNAEKPLLNMDMSNHRLPIVFFLASHLSDGPQRDELLPKLKRMLDMTIGSKWPEEFSSDDLITPDGGAIHHRTFHIAYASYSMPSLVGLVAKLQGTPCQISPFARERLRTFMFAQSFATTDDLKLPGSLDGRATISPLAFSQLPGLLRQMAEMGDPKGDGPVDRDMAALYLDKVGEENDFTQKYREMGIAPAKPTGHWSLNVTAAALHRRDNWLAVVDGSRNDRRGAEVYSTPGQGNSYCGNFVRGSLMIVATPDVNGKVSSEASGYRRTGWDWNFIPGSTTIERPWYQVSTLRRPSYISNRDSFAGGITLQEDGIWGMRFQNSETPSALKSAFCFGDRITMLTSDIDFDTPITTLFQLALDNHDDHQELQDETLRGFPLSRELPLDHPIRLRDTKGHGWYIHPDGGTLRLRRGEQQWTYLSDLREDTPDEIKALITGRMKAEDIEKVGAWCTPQTGDFTRAWIDHGESRSCAFSVTINGEAPAEPTYTILRQDSAAHILYDHATKTTGYVVFVADQPIGDKKQPLASVSRPCFVMWRQTDVGIQVSVGAPNMGDLSSIVLRLNGDWQLDDAGDNDIVTSKDDGETTVSIPFRDYGSNCFGLSRAADVPNE